MPARRPTKLGLTLTFCLLVGLMLWRIAVPGATAWLDIAALTAVALLLLGIKALMHKK
jgi:hypothetical protein